MCLSFVYLTVMEKKQTEFNSLKCSFPQDILIQSYDNSHNTWILKSIDVVIILHVYLRCQFNKKCLICLTIQQLFNCLLEQRKLFSVIENLTIACLSMNMFCQMIIPVPPTTARPPMPAITDRKRPIFFLEIKTRSSQNLKTNIFSELKAIQ